MLIFKRLATHAIRVVRIRRRIKLSKMRMSKMNTSASRRNRIIKKAPNTMERWRVLTVTSPISRTIDKSQQRSPTDLVRIQTYLRAQSNSRETRLPRQTLNTSWWATKKKNKRTNLWPSSKDCVIIPSLKQRHFRPHSSQCSAAEWSD